jgi:hypothetical protein
MNQQDPTRQTEHEKRVSEIEEGRERTEQGGLVGMTQETAGETGPTPYERQIAEEQTGEPAAELEDDVGEDVRTPSTPATPVAEPAERARLARQPRPSPAPRDSSMSSTRADQLKSFAP